MQACASALQSAAAALVNVPGLVGTEQPHTPATSKFSRKKTVQNNNICDSEMSPVGDPSPPNPLRTSYKYGPQAEYDCDLSGCKVKDALDGQLERRHRAEVKVAGDAARHQQGPIV